MTWKELVPKKSYVDVYNDATKEIDKIEEEWNEGYNKCISDHQPLYDYVERLEKAGAGGCPSIAMTHLLECDVCRTKYGLGKPPASKMDSPEHTCGLNFYCHGCYNLGYGQAIMDAKPSAGGGREEIVKILKEYTTHILWYHDKECGRTEDVEIIFASRITKLAHAIMEGIR